MYHGEVNINQDGLNSFLAAAEDLKVKGLTENKSNKGFSNSKQEATKRPLMSESFKKSSTPPKKIKKQGGSGPDDQVLIDSNSVKEEENDEVITVEGNEEIAVSDSEDFLDNEEYSVEDIEAKYEPLLDDDSIAHQPDYNPCKLHNIQCLFFFSLLL